MTAEEAAQIKRIHEECSRLRYSICIERTELHSSGERPVRQKYSSDKEKDHSWFIGMSNVEDPELVVSVIIEASDGTAKAVNVAKEIFDSYY